MANFDFLQEWMNGILINIHKVFQVTATEASNQTF